MHGELTKLLLDSFVGISLPTTRIEHEMDPRLLRGPQLASAEVCSNSLLWWDRVTIAGLGSLDVPQRPSAPLQVSLPLRLSVGDQQYCCLTDP